MEGVIYKGIGGFYTVKTEGDALVECKPRGIFRKRGIKPLAGDKVRLAQEAGTFVIDEIHPRRNTLVRPPVANVDQLVIVASTAEPTPSLLVIDKLAALALDRECSPVLVVTKPDLASPEPLVEAYRTSGIPTLVVCAEAGAESLDDGVEALRAMLAGKFSVLCGNSGVGKSTLLNAIAPGLERQVGEISQKLGRGRHTTREVEVFEVAGGLLADTPGFASFDMQDLRHGGAILAENLQLCFPEIKACIGGCKFSGCAHVAETGCAVRAAVEAGQIAPGRYQSYVTLYNQAKEAESSY